MNKRIGIISGLAADVSNLQRVLDFGLGTCQLNSWDPELWTDDLANTVKNRISETGINVTGFWAGWSGEHEWNFTRGPQTLGVVPKRLREKRVGELKKSADFAKKCGLPSIMTHLGFIPENPGDPEFGDVVAAVKDIAEYAGNLELEFWFETGQETPVTMLRLIEAVGTDNLGLNLDPANLILYGKGNPIDSLEVFGSFVKNVHVKDGLYPTDPMELGEEVKVGEGLVKFPEFLGKLTDIGFTGELIIEREISGDQQERDIRDTIEYLKRHLT